VGYLELRQITSIDLENFLLNEMEYGDFQPRKERELVNSEIKKRSQ
jgi:hypothetical protein